MHRLTGVIGMAFKQLRYRLLETLLILLGIALGVGVLTGVEAYHRFFADLQRQFELSDPTLSTVTVRPRTLDTAEFFTGEGVPALRVAGDFARPVTLTSEHLIATRRDVAAVAMATVTGSSSYGSAVEAIDGQTVRWASPASGTDGGSGRPLSFQVTVVTPDFLAMQGRRIIAGRSMTWDEYEAGTPVVVLEEDDAALLFPDTPPTEAVGRTVTSGAMGAPGPGGSSGIVWRIIGVVAKEDGARFGMPSHSSGADIVRGYASHTAVDPGRIHLNGLAFAPHDVNGMEELVRELETYFAGVLGDDRVEVINPLAMRAQMQATSRRSTATLMTIAGAALFVAAVNILNLFTARVLRRRRASAMMVALGARRRWLFHQVFAEALLLGVGGSVLGIGIASGVVRLMRTLLFGGASAAELETALNRALGLQMADVGFGLAVGVAVSVIFGLYPAYVGASMEPADGLRTE